MAKMGRPPNYTEAIGKEICDRLGEGESLNMICKDMDNITRTTVYNWLADEKYKHFLDNYVQARERQAETFVDQCVDISDDGTNDTIIKTGRNGDDIEVVNHDHINRSRLKVDTRIKIAQMMAPRKYTPRKEIEITGGEELAKALIAGRNRVCSTENEKN